MTHEQRHCRRRPEHAIGHQNGDSGHLVPNQKHRGGERNLTNSTRPKNKDGEHVETTSPMAFIIRFFKRGVKER